MLFKQVFEFELRGAWDLSNSNSIIHLLVHVLLQLAIFIKKNKKSLRKIFEWIIINWIVVIQLDCCLLLKILQKTMYLNFPYLGPITYKI